ncbi:class I SAM-dependent methyltransferase [Planctobacterium marinum]|uniref:class I SAM-dependent methyltransferase n=1 Tax=Planctobacterium marinum TaxID=1631968 RepID=UPI001E287D0F|nr:class I SAM-dependent methyltransferase [Planctobacterium marinum]
MALSFEQLIKITNQAGINLEKNDLDFVSRVYSEGVDKYRRRLEKLGFYNANKVLDAGAGFGQWSIALAELNTSVESIEFSDMRVITAQKIFELLNKRNVRIQKGSVESLPYENNSFDFVFCYGVLFLTDWKQSLRELARVLKPGGRMYINMNGDGWYDFLENSLHNATSDYDPAQVAVEARENTLNYKQNLPITNHYTDIITTRNEVVEQILDCDLLPIGIAGEGEIELGKSVDTESFFKARYQGSDCVFEIVSEKYS